VYDGDLETCFQRGSVFPSADCGTVCDALRYAVGEAEFSYTPERVKRR
jgi:hypothetical protein